MTDRLRDAPSGAVAGTPPRAAPRPVTAAVSLAAALVAPAASLAADGDTLRTVRERGALRCGVNTDLPGFAQANSLGAWSGLDVDLCRAVATAVFGDPEAVDFVPTPAVDRFDDLLSGGYDLLVHTTTWTLERDVEFGAFAGVNYYDGQGFMVPKRLGLRSALELDDRPICVTRETTTERNTIDYFASTAMRYRPVYFDDETEALASYAAGGCAAFTTDRSALAGLRTALERPDAHVVLPEILSKEPLGPLVRDDDDRWEEIVRWSLNCMVNAEELGLDSASVRDPAAASSPSARRLTGVEGEAGAALGLRAGWCADIVAEVGNYAESYERNVGPDTPLGLERGVNALWTDGGLMYAPPIR